MAATNQTQISSVLAQAGLGDISTSFLNVIATGYVSDTTVAPGTHMDWMALKRAGRASVLRNVRWTGQQAFEAFQFSVEANGYSYTFVVPKICGNFALLSRAPVPVAVAPPPPPPPAPEPEPAPVVQAPPPPPPAPIVEAERLYPWMATGFLGSSFGAGSSSFATALNAANLPVGINTADGGLTYGFQIGYLRRYFGGEFIGDFAPNFRMSSLALAKEPTVNSWMFNLIGAVPIRDQFEPYISGGIGGITLRSQTFDESAIPVVTVQGTLATEQNTINTARTAFAWNLGGGFFAYANKWGIRADIRYYQAQDFSTNNLNNGTVPSDFTQALLSGLNYWRANLGVSFRW